MEFLFVFWGISLTALLACLAWIDARTYQLPDVLTLPLIAAGLVQAATLKGTVVESLIGAAIGYFSFVIIEKSYKQLRGRDGLGRGDAKLLAAGGAWCGWAGLPWIVLMSSMLALLVIGGLGLANPKNLKSAYPYGPFLAFGIATIWIHQITTAHTIANN